MNNYNLGGVVSSENESNEGGDTHQSSVRLEGVTTRFGDFVAIENVNIEVEVGSFVALLGPSGCGKSTTLRSVCGLETIDEGEIYIGDELVASAKQDLHIPPYRRNVGMMFQSNALWPHMTVRENVLYPLKQKEDIKVSEHEHRVTELLETVDLPGIEDKAVTALSGGQQQRVALARALIYEPDVLLMDEPLSSLDARLQRSMRADIRSLQQQQKFTTIYVTHDQREALYLADEIYLMRDGHIVESETPEEIYSNSKNPFSMEFLDPNDPILGIIERVDDESVIVEVNKVESPLRVARPSGSFSKGDRCKLYIRPTNVEAVDETDATTDNILDATVELCAFQGSSYEARFSISDYSILGEIDRSLPVGDTVKVRFDPHKLRCFEREEDDE